MRPGYKQTEVGIIPEDWEVVSIGSIASFSSGYGISVLALDHESSDTPVPVYGGNGIAGYTSKSLVKEPVVVVGRVGQKCGEVYLTQGPAWITDNALYPRNMFRTIDMGFFGLAMKAAGLNDVKNRNDLPLVTQSILHSVRIPIPPTKAEQTTIAHVIRDVEGLLASLDRLIAKKRAVKLATMQQLLTGEKRLAGWNGRWETIPFTDICWFQEGPGVRKYQFTKSGVKLLNGTNIFRGRINLDTTDRYISDDEAYGRYSHFLAEEGDIVIASSGITIEKFDEKIAFVTSDHLPLCMNTSTIRFQANPEKLAQRFLYQYLMSNDFKEQIGKQATGSAQLNFGPYHISNVVINLPSLPEQRAIATILSDMDAEISALQARRDKTAAIKQGMMQQLLTGETRLV